MRYSSTYGTVAAITSPPGTLYQGILLGDALVGKDFAYSVRTEPNTISPNVLRCSRSIYTLPCWAMELIRAGTPTLVSDSTSKITLTEFIEGKILVDSPVLLETLTRMIYGRWLVVNQETAQVVPTDDIAEGEEDGKWVDEMKSELDEGNYSTSSLRINNRRTKCAKCETTFNTLADYVYHKQCNRCGGYVLECEADKYKLCHHHHVFIT